MAHPKPIKIFSNVTRGVMFFEGSTVTPKVLGIVNAYINPSISNRIIVERTDQQDSQGRNRRIFSKLQPARVQDVYGNFLLEEGYTFQQVVNYINSQANADLATSQDEFNAYVDPLYDISNGASTGSSTYPFTSLQTAMETVSGGSKIFVRGINTITNPLTADLGKSLTIIGGLSTVVGYSEYDPTSTSNIFQLSCETPVHGAVFEFQDLILDNAGGWGINVNNATEVNVIDCTFRNNGWNGEGLTLTSAQSGDILGYNSSVASLTAHNALSASEGGAIRVNTGLKVTITDNEIKDGNHAIKLIDTGFAEPSSNVFVEGSTIIARNQIFRNLGIGIEMCPRDYDLDYATEGRNGNRNTTIYNNAITDNGDDGIRNTGGMDNTISLNTIYRNWAAGVHTHSGSNLRIRDLDLANNNRSTNGANGITRMGDASVLVMGDYINTAAAFITEILNVQILNTDDVTTVSKNGIEIGAAIGNISDAAAIISIDNIGFLNQDYSITNRADLTNINLSIGDCKFIDSNQTNIRNLALDSQNNFYELPFSNHTTTINVIDVEVNYTSQTIIIKEGVGGETLNSYHIQQLVASADSNGTIQITENNTNRIQVGALQHTHVNINGALASGTLQEVVNQLNGAFTETDPGTSTGTTTLIVDFSGSPLEPLSGTNTTAVSGGAGFQANGNGENNGTLFGAVYAASQALTASGEYFTFEVTGVGDFSMGLFDFAEPDTSIYSITSAGTGAGTYAYGYQFAHVFGRTPVGPWKTVGKNNSYIGMDGWSTGTDDQKFDSATGGYAAWSSGETIEFKVGLNADNFIQVDYLNTHLNQYVPITRSSYVGSSLSGYGLLIKLGDTATTITDIRTHLIDQDAITALSGLDAVALNFRYIESPDGAFTFPLFNDENAAKYVDENITDFFPNLTQFTPGAGAAQAETFIDEDPVSNIWYEPSSVNYTFSGNPFDYALSAEWISPYIQWNEIQTTTDASAAPAAFTDTTLTFTEGDTVNYPVAPADATFSTTVASLPNGFSFNSATGFVTGTVGLIPEDTTILTTITRSNSYGSSDGLLTFNLTDVASPFTGFTQIGGNFAGTNQIQLDYDALMRFDSYLSAGQKVTWTHDKDYPEPMFGLLNSTGNTAVDQLSNTSNNYYDELGSGAYDFAGTGKWDLRWRLIGDNIGGTVGKDQLVGWHNNTHITGVTDVNDDAAFELVNDSTDNYLKLYRNDVLMLSSATTYPAEGVQFHVAAFENDDWVNAYVPNDFALVNQAFGSTTAPAGFTSPLLGGGMTNSTLMGIGSADAVVGIPGGLKVNHRYAVADTWVETNVLPYLDEVNEKAFIGVPKDGADWTDVDLDDDFYAAIRLENNSSGSDRHSSRLNTRGATPLSQAVNVSSLTDSLYNYALEWDGFDLSLIATQNSSDLTTQYGVTSGGTFDRALTYSGGFGVSAHAEELALALAVDEGGQINLTTSGLTEVRIPWNPAITVLAATDGLGSGRFKSGNIASDYDIAGNSPTGFTANDLPTFAAGTRYTFIYHPSMDALDHLELRDSTGTVYTTGSAAFDYTTDGDPDATSDYKGFCWDVPADVPPLNLFFYSHINGGNDLGRGLTFSGSTYTVGVSGIDLEGPAANQTGTNVMDAGDFGWISLDETLGAGERLVLDNAFFTDFFGEFMDTNNIFAIGLKGDNWVNTKEMNSAGAASTGEFFKGNTYIVGVCSSGGSQVTMAIVAGGSGGNATVLNTTALRNTVCAFLEVTGSGNNIRAAFGRNGSNGVTAGSESTTTYGNWLSQKGQTGEQGYGITNLDVVMGFWTYNGGDIDGDEIDWTALTEISIPTAAALTTSWTKALDFSGSNERIEQKLDGIFYSPVMMAGVSTTTTGGSNTGNASGDLNARPWTTSIVFSSDNNSSNQHVWNVGEGAGSTDDNINLRIDSSRGMWFEWGRTGALNACYLGNLSISAGTWYGVYIGHTGKRLSGGHSASDIANCFDIRIVNLTSGATGTNLSTSGNWTTGSFGARMDREILGDTTIGGRGSNRNFHGKVAAMTIATLRRSQTMPSDTEISMMVRDPEQWLVDYKVGELWRPPNQAGNYSSWQPNNYSAGYAAQVWLMGDGTGDGYAQIRNQANWGDYQVTLMDMISMVSNDIETVNIPGLT